jgi:hypothetical protein
MWDQQHCEQVLKQFDDIQDSLQAKHRERAELLKSLAGSVWFLASRQHGTRVIQRAFQVANADERVTMAKELQGHVKDAWKSLYAVFVLELCIELMPPLKVEFIVVEMLEEMEAAGRVDAALHPQGIRVLQRLIEHCLIEPPSEPQSELAADAPTNRCLELVDKIIMNTEELVNHKFGNFVLQWVLDFGIADRPRRVAQCLLDYGVLELAERSPACHVLEKALEVSDGEMKENLAGPLRSSVPRLKKHSVGSWIVKCMRRLELLDYELRPSSPDGEACTADREA